MIAGFDEWAASAQVGHVLPLEQLRNHRLGIDAEDYINNLLANQPTREPLLPALGGLPFSLKGIVESHISILEQHGVEPTFVFNGLSHNAQEDRMRIMAGSAKAFAAAWDLYGASQPDQAVNEFGTLCTLDVENVYRYVQTILRKRGVKFFIAPYSAAAQLASIAGSEFCDAVAGSPETLMFEIDKLITKLDFEHKEITLVTRKECVEALGCTSIGMFVDACLLAGSSFLPTLPALENEISPLPKPPRVKAAADLLKQRNVHTNVICMQYQQEDPIMAAMDYVDRYRKASCSIKQHVVMRPSGEVVSLDAPHVPRDMHAFMGQRLPDEIFAYLSRGIIGPEVPQWRSLGVIVERPPLDGGESQVYHRLVRERLTPLRASAVGLLSQSLNRYYGKTDITVRCWFDIDGDHTNLGIPGSSDPRAEIAAWNVRIEQIGERANQLEREISSLAFSVKSLDDTSFAKSTITPKTAGYKPLDGPSEVRCNAVWRFLQLRGYISADHTLSPIGKSLLAAFIKAGDQRLEESVIVALELLRLDALNADDMFTNYGGAPMRGSETDKRNTLLISRVACLGNLEHKSIGFTGPLSRHLLAYRSMISVVRRSLRDMVEMSLCSMLMDGTVTRDLSLAELADVSFDLPFLLETDCALGIAVKSYLDELAGHPDPSSPEAREETKTTGVSPWFPHAKNFVGDLEKAFKLWDAVYAAVEVAPSNVISSKDKKIWEEANAWLAERR
ncbi:hypothetical protein AAFC00_002718 [Neodothiora populina]|uniref:Uncharacterized protein n=1 Tax=Neodothiora populina TaxID=2781224 RepID=A0ABR3P8P9_9PEZI